MSEQSFSEKRSARHDSPTSSLHRSAKSAEHDRDPSSEKNGLPQTEQTADVPPDGGLRAWLTVLGAFCAAFCSFGWVNSIGVFQEYYQNVALKQYSPSTIAWITSLETFFMFILGPVVGRIYDSFGSAHLMAVGTILHIFGLMMTSLAHEYYQFILAQGVCSAIGLALVFQPPLNAVSTYFVKKRAAAFGLTVAGSSVGGIIFPIMLERLINEIGFPWAMRACAFFMLGLLIIANICVRPRIKPTPQRLSFADFTEPFKDWTFTLTTLGNFIFIFGFFIPIAFIIVEALTHGMSASLATYLLAMLNGASFFGRVFAGFIGDKVGRYNIYILCAYTTAILILGLWIPATSNAAIICFAVFVGFFSGAYISLLPALIAQISPPKKIGTNTGLIMCLNSVGALTASPIAGAIIGSEHGGYRGIKIFSGVMCFVGATLFLFARVAAVGINPTKKF